MCPWYGHHIGSSPIGGFVLILAKIAVLVIIILLIAPILVDGGESASEDIEEIIEEFNKNDEI